MPAHSLSATSFVVHVTARHPTPAAAAHGMADLASVWSALEGWDQERPKILRLADCRVRLYMGAMAIPMVAVQPPSTGWKRS